MLPWRNLPAGRQGRIDPYKILVSEIMLQQTQVERVIPFYKAFLKKFLTARSLASAPLSKVLKAWSGLGYNRRAKFLREAAKAVSQKHRGVFPRSYEELLSLPGVGDYTARAVRVFAFNEPDCLIETNIRTVFTHHFFPRARKIADAKLLPLIAKAAAGQEPRAWHAALMDYGSYLKRTGVRINTKSAHYAKQEKFEGSLRQVRGEILKALAQDKGLGEVRKNFPLFQEALKSLRREGLLPATRSR